MTDGLLKDPITAMGLSLWTGELYIILGEPSGHCRIEPG